MHHHQATSFRNHQPLEENIQSGELEPDVMIDRHAINISNNADRESQPNNSSSLLKNLRYT